MGWSKGQSGNPSGRPKAMAGLRARLEAEFGVDARVIVDRLKQMIESPDDRAAFNACRLALAYLAGTPVQRVEMAGAEDLPALRVALTHATSPDAEHGLPVA